MKPLDSLPMSVCFIITNLSETPNLNNHIQSQHPESEKRQRSYEVVQAITRVSICWVLTGTGTILMYVINSFKSQNKVML